MNHKVSYTLTRDWHAAGLATTIMGLVMLSATFPWGGYFYNITMSNSIGKSLFALIAAYFLYKPFLRTPLTAIWFLSKSARKNRIMNRLVCAPDVLAQSEEEVVAAKRAALVQYAVLAIFLISLAFALMLSIFIALGAHALAWFNNFSLIFGIVGALWAAMFQLYTRIPALREVRWLSAVLFVRKGGAV